VSPDNRPDPQRASGRGLGLSTRVQVTGHLFLARRAALALTRRRVRMEYEPGRRQSMALAASMTVAAVICLAALLWSFLKPASSVGDSAILADSDSGALYVRVGDTLYPALNLASARLITGRAVNPAKVRPAEINSRPHGPLVGIPGAPSELSPTSPASSSWLVCDSVTTAVGPGAPEPVTVTVIDGKPDLSGHRRVLSADTDAVVLRYGSDSWVIRGGRRSHIDPADRSVLLALGLTPEQVAGARPMSRALFEALPVGPPLSVPVVPGAGGPAQFPGAPGPVGSVFVTPQVSGPQQYSLVLVDGVQSVSPVVAQILQNAAGGGSPPPVVAASVLAQMPVVAGIDVSAYPSGPLQVVDTYANPSTCWSWERTRGEPQARTQVISGASVPVATDQANKEVSLVKADTSGGEADQVFFGPGYANFVVVTGNTPTAATLESLWWVSASGVRFGVDRDQQTLTSLGFTTAPDPAPWTVVRLLAPGPMLSRSDALVRHDTLPTDLNPGELVLPK
jgi:type VII secretion protein EccB